MATYADLQEVSAIAEASYNQVVVVSGKLVNLYTAPITMDVRGALEYGPTPWPTLSFSYFPYTLEGGAYKWTSSIFYMPDHDVKVHVYSYWYGTDGQYHLDDEVVVAVDLLEVDYVFSIGVPAVSLA